MYAPIKVGYYTNATQTNKGFVDYVFPNIDSYNADSIQYDSGRIDYLIGSTGFYSNILVEQPSGWVVNWELINIVWENTNINWE